MQSEIIFLTMKINRLNVTKEKPRPGFYVHDNLTTQHQVKSIMQEYNPLVQCIHQYSLSLFLSAWLSMFFNVTELLLSYYYELL